jgi:outer membrane receptor protein involved in Fe transport
VNTQEAGGSEARLFGVTVTQDFDWANLISATNYLDKDSTEFIDATSFAAPFITDVTGVAIQPSQGVGFAGLTRYDTFSEEIRLASPTTQTWQWLVGAFYSHSRSNFEQYIPTYTVPQLNSFGSRGLYDANELTSRTQVAGFGELTYNFSERFSLTAGARVAALTARYTSGSTGLLGGTAAETFNTSSDPITKKFLASYKVTPDNLLYAQAAQGFREGSAELPVPDAQCGADLRSFGLASSPTKYDPDKLWSYELGSKNTLFDKRVTFDGAVYYIDWPNRQQAITLPTCQDSIILNAGKAVSKGVELESSVRPLDDLSLNASMSYTSSRITSFPQLPIFVDNRLPLAPDWQWDVNAQYNFAAIGAVKAFVRGDISHVGSRWNILQGEGGTASLMSGYTLGSARLGFIARHWETDLFVTNLTDARVVVNRDVNGNGANNSDLIAEPRVIGLSVKFMY